MAFLTKFSRAFRASRQPLSRAFGSTHNEHHNERKIDWNTEYFSDKPILPEREEWAGFRYYPIKESGPLKSNTVLAFSHRFFLDHTQWDPVVQRLNKKYRCLQWDLPRHGMSAHLEEQPSYHLMAGELSKILKSETMGPPEYIVAIGEELGGWVSNYLRFFQHNSGDQKTSFVLDALVLVNSGFDFWRDTERQQIEVILAQWRQFGFTQEVAGLLAAYQFAKPVSDPIVAPWLEKWKKLNPDDLYSFYRYGSDLEGFLAKKQTWDSPRSLLPFEAPTLLIRGKNDGSLTDEHIELFEEAVPKASKVFDEPVYQYPRKVIEIPNAGRVLSLTHPDVLADEIDEFLNTLPLDLSEKDTPRDWFGRP